MISRLAGVTVAGLMVFSGTAHAYPVKGVPELTHNALYKEGKLPKTPCALKKGRSRSSTEKYVKELAGCLRSAWKGAIDIPEPVEVEFTRDDLPCSNAEEVDGSYAEICVATLRVRVGNDWIKAKDDVRVFGAVARAWGGVVQGRTGIGQAWYAMPNGSEAELNEQTRRFYLQKDCLAGVTAKSLGRKVKDFKPLIAALEPQGYVRLKWEAKPGNRLYWVKKGYRAGKPGACNTWTASSSKVA